MSLTKFNGETNNIQSLPDKPTQTASQLKTLFDKTGDDLKTYINSTLTTELDTSLGTKANSSNVYTKTETDTALATKADSSDVYTKTEIDNKLSDSGWITIDINADFYMSSQKIYLRKIGKIVQLYASLQTSEYRRIAPSDTVANIPSGYRPTTSLSLICSARDDTSIYRLNIGADGKITLYANISVDGALSMGYMPISTKFKMNAMYMV